MNKNILIINTKKCETAWFDYLSALNQQGFNLLLLASAPSLLSYFKSKNWFNKTYYKKINPEKSTTLSLLFFLLRPITFLSALGKLLFFKFSKKIDTILCFGIYEKLYFTRAAKLIKLKIIWVFSPGEEIDKIGFNRQSLSRLSKLATTICLTKNCQNDFNDHRIKIKNINTIKIGLKSNHYLEQKNIFKSLAKNNSLNNNKKFFTLGAIEESSDSIDHLEKLLHATKKCLEFIPHIQLIIVIEGEKKKKLAWMAKKMNIDNLVWFVGNHKQPQKWISNFDLYISSCPDPKLKDLNNLLLASFNSLSIIAPHNAGFDEFVQDKQTGLLININNSEELANAIINLQQNEKKRIQFGENGHQLVINKFKFDNTIKELINILRK